MSKFKVGDKVRRVAKNRDQTVRTVTKVLDGGWFNHDGGKEHKDYSAISECWPGYWELAPYSSYFTETPNIPTTDGGHIAGSPIQKHSKGEFYPLCVVGYSDAGRIAFTIEDLEKGTVVGFAPGEFKGGSNIRAWGNAAAAYKWLDDNQLAVKAGVYKMIEGRPTFIKHSLGLEIVVPLKHKRWAVVLDKVALDKEAMLINGVYYQALEQDIG